MIFNVIICNFNNVPNMCIISLIMEYYFIIFVLSVPLKHNFCYFQLDSPITNIITTLATGPSS